MVCNGAVFTPSRLKKLVTNGSLSGCGKWAGGWGSGWAVPPEAGPLGCSYFTWQLDLHTAMLQQSDVHFAGRYVEAIYGDGGWLPLAQVLVEASPARI